MIRLLCVGDEASAEGVSTGFVHFVVVVLLVALSPAQGLSRQDGGVIRAVNVSGNTNVDATTLRSWMPVKVGDRFLQANLDSTFKEIQHRYRLYGFPFARVDSFSVSKEESAVDVRIFLTEGKPALLHSVRMEGNTVLDADDLLREFTNDIGERFLPGRVEEGLHAILRHYERAGYPFAAASLKDLTMRETDRGYDVELVFSIHEGQPVIVTSLVVEGNKITKDEILVREARLHNGVRWTPELPALVQQRLQKLQIFSSVSMPELILRNDGTAGFRVRVTEGRQNWVDGMIGYLPPSSGGGSGSVMGFVNLQFRNLFGTGRRLATRWYRENPFTQEIELRYHEPWIASFPVNGDLGFLQRKQDSSYVRRHYDLSTEFMLSEAFRIGASFAQADVIPAEGQAGVLLAESHNTSIGGYLVYDARDDVVTPKRGIFYRTEFHTGKKNRSLGGSTVSNTTQRIGLDLEYTHSLAQRHVLNTALHAREFRSGGIDVSDLYRLGGATTLRGYREGQFLGSRLVWSNLEYRLLAAPRSFFYLFTDVGYIATPDPAVAGRADSEQTKVGYGIGARIDTALGLFGVSVALGEGDTFSTAKLHLRLVNEF